MEPQDATQRTRKLNADNSNISLEKEFALRKLLTLFRLEMRKIQAFLFSISRLYILLEIKMKISIQSEIKPSKNRLLGIKTDKNLKKTRKNW